MIETINTLARTRHHLLAALGREPTPDDLARELGISTAQITAIEKHNRDPMSLYAPIGGTDAEFGELIEDGDTQAPETAASAALLRQQLHTVLGTISDREAGVVSMRFGLTDGHPKTLDEVGRVYGGSRERIRQIENKALAKLRHPARFQPLRGYQD